MAPSAKSATDREHERALLTTWQQAVMAFSGHCKQCARCKGKGNPAQRACPAGWELIKAAHAARQDLDTWTRAGRQEQGNGQGTLW